MDVDTVKNSVINNQPKAFLDDIDYINNSSELDAFHDSAIEHASKSITVFYAMNFEGEMTNWKFKLGNLPVNINSSLSSKGATELHGINIPSYYIGSPYSISSMHCEDGNLDAANLLLAGPNSGYKIWLIINPLYSYYLNALITLKIDELKKNIKSKKKQHYLTKWDSNCPTPFHHKSLVLTTKFLRTHNIKYKIVVQRPGDLIYIQPGVYHQVVNGNTNACEAVNVGSSLWQIAAHLFVSCRCSDRSIDYIIPNLNTAHNDVELRQKELSLVCEICSSYFNNTLSKKKHICRHKTYTCDICGASFVRKFTLTRHLLTGHENMRKIGTRKCKFCLSQIAIGNHSYHQKNCNITDEAKPKFTCNKCLKVFRRIDVHRC